MELDLQGFFGLHVHILICTHWLRPCNPPPPPHPLHLSSYTRVLLVSQDRRHLFVTPWYPSYLPVTSETFSLCVHWVWVWDPRSGSRKILSRIRVQGSKRHRIPDPQHRKNNMSVFFQFSSGQVAPFFFLATNFIRVVILLT
jgi:hypothetical protein